MSVTISPYPFLFFMNPNNSGAPAAGFLLFTYVAGTSTKQNTWTDSTQTVVNPNPLPLDSNGAGYVWIDPSKKYKFVLAPPNDTDPPTSPLRTTDNIEGPITASVFSQFAGALIYPQTPAENVLGVTPSNFNYPTLNVKRYGAVGDGVTDDRAAILTAWNVAKQQGGGSIVFPFGAVYAVNSLDPNSPINLPQQGAAGTLYQPYQTCLYFKSASDIVFDFQGSTLSTTITGGGAFIMFDNCSNIRLLGPRITGPQVQSTGVVSLGTITGGSGYTGGTYNNVLLTGGSGGGAVAGITVAGGAVTSVTMAYPGGGFAVNDVLSCSNASIGGTGSGFSVPVTSVTGAGPTVAVAGPNAIVVCAVSGSSSNIAVHDLDVYGMYTCFYTPGDPALANTVTHCSLTGYTRMQNGEYGVALHNTGDDTVINNLYTYRVARPFFFYGVKNVWAYVVGDQNHFGFQAIIKSYLRNTRNISVRYSNINQPGQSGSVAKLAIQVQCDPAVMNPPPIVQNVTIDYDEDNINFGTGTDGIEFAYFAGAGGATPTASSNLTLFDNIILRGKMVTCLQTQVALGGNALCRINVDGLSYQHPAGALDVSAGNGFVTANIFTYTPTLKFGGGNTGMTGTFNGEYYIAGGRCFVQAAITLTAKGSSNGSAAISLPFVVRPDANQRALGYGIGLNMVSMTAPIVSIQATGSSSASLQQQGATNYTSVSDGNFTNTSAIVFQTDYPI